VASPARCNTAAIAARKTPGANVSAPDLPELEPTDVSRGRDDLLVLERALLEACDEPLAIERLDLMESELRGVGLTASRPLELRLRDVALSDCDLSNIAAHRGAVLTRVAVHHSRLIGVGLAEGKLRDVAFVDCMLSLGSFAFAELRHVKFERVKLREATFMDARLEDVSFIDCQIEGADFRGVALQNCLMRGSSLEGVVGIESLRGLTMPWSDLVASTEALAAAAGIAVEQ
jgi:uncharacterized protein YjbI with pentapeptide repeats